MAEYNAYVIEVAANPNNPNFPGEVTNVPKNPQPGDQTVQDIFQNIFDNFNKIPGTYQLAGVETAPDGTRTALTPASLNQGVLPRYDVEYAVNTNNPTFPGPVSNVLRDPQPLYQNLDYVRYIIEVAANPNNPNFPGEVTNKVDPNPFKPDAFDYERVAIEYLVNPNNPTFPGPVQNIPGPPLEPYVRTDAENNIPASTFQVGETVHLLLQLSSDIDSPVFVTEDKLYTLNLNGL